MNDLAVTSTYATGEYATGALALFLAVVTVYVVLDRETKRYGLAARQWPAWLAFTLSFPAYLAVETVLIR